MGQGNQGEPHNSDRLAATAKNEPHRAPEASEGPAVRRARDDKPAIPVRLVGLGFGLFDFVKITSTNHRVTA
jgi:hypothetical protein